MNRRRPLLAGTALSAALLILAAPQRADAQAAQVIDNETVNVPGDRESPWNVGDFGAGLVIGSNGTATLNIVDGGYVKNTNAVIGDNAGSIGLVTISGPGSTWLTTASNSVQGDVVVGRAGSGTLVVDNGGVVDNIEGVIGYATGSIGSATITGPGSTWINRDRVDVGVDGSGILLVEDGGSVTAGSSWIGVFGGTGAVSLSGEGSTLTTSYMSIGYVGSGTLTIASDASVNGGDVDIASVAGSTGIINIGAAPGETAVAAGMLQATSLVFGSGTGSINFNHTDTDYVFASPISGLGVVNHYAGTTILTGSNSYTGETYVHGGTLIVEGQSVQGAGQYYVGTEPGDNGNLIIRNGGSVTSAAGHIGGGIPLFGSGTGSVTVTGEGSSWINSGTLHVGEGGIGSSSLLIADGGSVSNTDAFVGGDSGATGSATVTGEGSTWTSSGTFLVGQQGTASLIIADGAVVNVGAGAGVVDLAFGASSNGTLIIGAASDDDAAGAGTLEAAEVRFGSGTGAINFNHSETDYAFDPLITGGGALDHHAGTTRLTANSTTFTGPTSVFGGTLLVDGATASATNVADGGTLGGKGTIEAAVTVADGGTLAGVQGETLIMASLSLSSTSIVNATLGPADASPALFDVTGDLVLDGTLDVNARVGFGAGVYKIFHYGGTLTNAGLEIGDVPFGTAAGDYEIQIAVANEINLVNSSDQSLYFWDGPAASWNNDALDGGSGTWTALSTTWTGADGATNAAMTSPGFAIFMAAPGTVTVDDSGGAIGVTGMQFAVDGYTVVGDAITLADAETLVRVGDGTAAGDGYEAVIGSVLTGAGGLVKDDLGALILTGANTYTGLTTISAGTLQIGDGGTTGTLGTGNVVNNAALVFNRSNTITVGNGISGIGLLRQDGTGRLILSGPNTYSGGTSLANGTVQSGSLNGSNQFNSFGTGEIIFGGGSLRTTATGTLTNIILWRPVTTGALSAAAGTTLTLTGDFRIAIDGASNPTLRFGSLTDTGTIIFAPASVALEFLNGAGGFGQSLIVEGGTLWAGNGQLGYITSNFGLTQINSGATLDFNGHIATVRNLAGAGTLLNSVTTSIQGGNFAGTIAGDGGITKTSTGTLILTGANTYSGVTTISEGMLQIGDGGTTGTLGTGNVVNNAALVFDRSNASSYGGSISGTGSLTNLAGTLSLTGDSSGLSGGVDVTGGTLRVDGTLGSSGLDVASGAVLTGAGSIAAAVTIADGGVLAGTQGETLTMASLSLSSGSFVNATLGAADGSAALFAVTGDLLLDGELNITDAGEFGAGVYSLFTYGGDLDDQGLALGTVPAEASSADFFVQTSVENQVNLISTAGVDLLFWDGGNEALHDNGAVNGGSGTWTTAGRAWTTSDGALNNAMSPQPGYAVFQGMAGTVTVDDSAGGVGVTGMQFAVDGYVVEGDAITLTEASTPIRVGNGAAGGAGFTATIASPLTGTGGLVKADLGTLILTDANDHSGGTTISAGILQIGNGGMTGSISGNIVDNGSLIFNRSDAIGFAGNISGTGSLTKLGGSSLTLTGTNSYSGGTTISAGTLQVGNGGTTGSIAGGIVNNAALVFNRSNTSTFAGDVSGSGGLTKLGAGTLILTGSSSHSGGTTVSAGTLQVGNGGTTGAILGDIANNAALVFNRSDEHVYGGVISGNGSLTNMNGVLTLTGNSSGFAGATNVSGGTLRVDGLLGSTGIIVASGGTLTGAGSIAAAVDIADGGILAGAQGETLTMASLSLSSGSFVNVALGAADGSDALFDVTGNLVLGGTLNVTDAGDFGAGVYSLFTYGGTLTGDGLAIGAVPAGTGPDDLLVQTGVANQVNLISIAGVDLLFWDGGNTALHNNAAIDGGSGSWTAAGRAWTTADGAVNSAMRPQPGFAIFQAAPGTVTVEDSAGLVSATGMQFAADGYVVTGDALTLAGESAVIRVGNGAASGAAFTATIASELTGTAALVKSDFGTLILTGANTYTGGTRVEAGRLIGDTDSIRGDIVNDGLVLFDQGFDASFSGTIGGTGEMVKDGSATLTLTGASSADWSVTEGRLVSSAPLFSGDLDIAGGAEFTFDQDHDGSYAGILTGAGSLSFGGDGHVTFSGDSSGFDGTTTVGSGLLSVNGRLGGALELLAGARLQGSGIVGQARIGGTIAPGNSIGTLTVDGDFTFLASADYEVEVNPQGQSDLISVTGKATIEGGSVIALASGGDYAPLTDYKILTAAGGVDGTFDDVSANLAFLDPYLSYGVNAVTLRLVRNDIDFGDVAETGNQGAVASAVQALGYGNPVYNAVLTLDAADARLAYDQLSGKGHATLGGALVEDSRFIRNALLARSATAGPGAGIWGRAYGSWNDGEGSRGDAELDRSIEGFVTGLDTTAGENWRFGAAFGYSNSELRVDQGYQAKIESYTASAYAGADYGRLSIDFGAAQSWHDARTERLIVFPGFANAATSEHDLKSTQIFGQLGWRLTEGGVRIEPFAGLAYVHLSAEDIAEVGSAAALSGEVADLATTFASLGVRAAYEFTVGGTTLSLHGSGTVRRAMGDRAPTASFAFGSGVPFVIVGTPIDRTTFALEAGVDAALSRRVRIGAGYMGQYGKRTNDHGAQATISWVF